MDHLAIMIGKWEFLEKILSGEKVIESRWYKSKKAPWDRIKKGDAIFFKNSGELVLAKAEVEKLIQFENLNPNKVKAVLNKYGKDIGIEKSSAAKFFEKFRGSKYCILIFLKNPRQVKPFEINKKGFGNMASWICVKDINIIKI